MKVYVLHENDDWMEPIRGALRKESVDFEEWHLGRFKTLDLQSVPPEGVFYNRISPSSHTRGNGGAVYFLQSILSWLNRHNRKIVNNKEAFSIEISKVEQYNRLLESKINVPKTKIALGKDSLKALVIQDKHPYPFIVKPNMGGKGLGVHVFHNRFQFDDFISNKDYIGSPDSIYLIQEYIPPKDSYIMRAEFIGGEFIYVVKIDTSGGFELCPADLCSVKDATSLNDNRVKEKFTIIQDFANPIIQQYKNFISKNGIDTTGIEFLCDNNGDLYTYDVNVTTNYNVAAEEKAGISCYRNLAIYLKRALLNQV